MLALRRGAWMVFALALTACGTVDEDPPDGMSRTLLGNVDAPKFKVIASAKDGLFGPRDLGFHPERTGELWVVNRGDESVVIVFGATGDAPTYEKRLDPARNHFMAVVSSMAFGAKNFRNDYTFATCQESENTYGGTHPPNFFMGPALWSANLEVYAILDLMGGGLGSHLDMLHHSPLCMGIAHETENAYWVFDGYNGQIVRYDFQKDHGPGFDDHSDGIIHFLDEPKVKRVENVPSHMVIDRETRQLYVADTGNSRVLRVDIDKRANPQPLEPKELGTVVEEYTSTDWSEVVPAGTIKRPSGIAVHEGILYVGDNVDGKIYAYQLDEDHGPAELIEILETGIEFGGLMGIEVGPDERLYLVDFNGRVLRVQR